MVSIRHYMNIVEHASDYGRVTTPQGDGNVLKMTMQKVSVQLDSGEIEDFTQNEVRSIPDRRKEPRPSTKDLSVSSAPKDYSFSAAQLASGQNTPALK